MPTSLSPEERKIEEIKREIEETFYIEGSKEERKWYRWLFRKHKRTELEDKEREETVKNIEEDKKKTKDWFLGFIPVDRKCILGDHEKVSRRVFRRLLLRYSQLKILDELTSEQLKNKINIDENALSKDVKSGFKSSYSKTTLEEDSDNKTKKYTILASQNEKNNGDNNKSKDSKGFLIYKHAITDLFVEKAITYLEIQASRYKWWGLVSYFFGLIIILIAMFLSGGLYLYKSNITLNDVWSIVTNDNNYTKKIDTAYAILANEVLIKNDSIETLNKTTVNRNMIRSIDKKNHIDIIVDTNSVSVSNGSKMWYEVTEKFILAFTFYGFLVLAAVGLWRFGRAMLDQSERLLERRHALRQGRLYVHLHNGDLSIDDMERAFNWNVSQPNAFSHMSTDAKAPWGVVLSEAIKAGAEVAKSAKNVKESKDRN